MRHAHYLRPNEVERSPKLILFYDTEAVPIPGCDPEVQRLRLWSACAVLRRGHEPRKDREQWYRGRTREQLAQLVDELAGGSAPLYVCAHNLSYDLTTTQLPVQLHGLGWTLGSHNLPSDAPWGHMRQGRHTVRLIDSFSYLPRSEEEIGDAIGLPKLRMPDWEEADDAWWTYCERDVAILASSMVQLMDWWDASQLGCWTDTGPGCGWNSFRHMSIRGPKAAPMFTRGPRVGTFPYLDTGRVVIDQDEEARAFERQALYAGRQECWRTGRMEGRQWVELDMVRSYLTCAAEYPLPFRRGYRFSSLPLDSEYLEGPHLGVIAECVIRTDVPRYPLRGRRGLIYPVGTFRTVLAGPEVAEAHRRGDLLSVGAGYGYPLRFVMQPWADWCARVIDGEEPDTPPTARIAAKGWSKAVPGRWALRTSRVVATSPHSEQGWWAEHSRQAGTGAPVTTWAMAGRWEMVIRDQEAENAFPAVLAWLQSICRVALGRAIDHLGDDAMLSCCTDGLIVAADRLAQLAGAGEEYRAHPEELSTLADLGAAMLTELDPRLPWQAKGVYRSVRALGPLHMVLDGRRRMAGVPSGARTVGPDTLEFETWPKLGSQMHQGDGRGYRRGRKTMSFGHLMVNRWRAEDGCCEPVEVRWTAATGNVTLAPSRPGCRRHGSPWREAQWLDLPRLTPWSTDS